ncbi:MAG: ferrous iron transport protein B, partial [Armatimonadota bacterium]
ILTGLHQHVGNWPCKTVERKQGTCRLADHVLECVDLPGTYSLTAHSAEEVIARDYVLQEKPDVVVVIVDASNIERNFYLVAQMLELTDRVVVALNMMDLAGVKGYRIFPHKLEEALGVPVIPMVARRAQGCQELLQAIVEVGTGRRATSPRPIQYGRAQPTLAALREILAGEQPGGYPTGWIALKMLEGDEEVERLEQRALPEETRDRLHRLLLEHEHGPAMVADARYAWIEDVLRAGMARPAGSVITFTDRIDHIVTHRFLGLPILLGIFVAVFWLTFKVSTPLSHMLDAGFAGLGEWIGDALAGGPAWLTSLLAEGVIPGVGGVLTFLPIILVFFLFLGVLEDSGYMARAAFVMDRIMHAMGLHGKAFLSLLVAYGCNVPGIMATRILETERDRLLAILVNPLIPCAARIGVAAFFVGAFFPPALRTPVMASLYALSLALVILAGFLLRRTVLPGEESPFMMELPLYRSPSLRNLAMFTGWRLLAFMKKAGTVILAISVLVWLLSSFPAGADLPQTYLGRLGFWLEPAGKLLGLDWRMSVALVTGFAAKETSLATLGVLYHAEGDSLAQALRHGITPLVALVFVVVQLLYVPCLATVAVMRSETNSWKWTALGVIYPLALAAGLGLLVFEAGTALGFG